MTQKTALTIIFVIAICGVLFSGYLSFYELFVPAGCSEAVISCGEKITSIASLPACVYGLVMYMVVLVVSGVALFGKKKEV